MSTKTVTIEFSADMKRDNITYREPFRTTIWSNDDLEKLKICLGHNIYITKKNYGIPWYIVNRVLNVIPVRVPTVWRHVDIIVASDHAELRYMLAQPAQDKSVSGIFVEYPPNTYRSNGMITRQVMDEECHGDDLFDLFLKQQFSKQPDCDVFYTYSHYAVMTFGNKEQTEKEETMDKNTSGVTRTVALQLAEKLNIPEDQTYRTNLAATHDVYEWFLSICQNKTAASQWCAIPQRIFSQVKTAILLLTMNRNVSDISIEITDASVTLVYRDHNCEKSTYQEGMIVNIPKGIEPLHNDQTVTVNSLECIPTLFGNNNPYSQYIAQLFIEFPNYTMFYGYLNYAIMTMPEIIKEEPMKTTDTHTDKTVNVESPISDYFKKPSDVTVYDTKSILFAPKVENEAAYYEALEDTIADLLVETKGYWPHDDICVYIKNRTIGTPRNLFLTRNKDGLKVKYKETISFTSPSAEHITDDTSVEQTRHTIDICHDDKPTDRNTVFRNMSFASGLIYLSGLALVDPTAKALMEKYLKF